MAASDGDLAALQDQLALPNSRQLYMSRLYYDAADAHAPCLLGPVMGAPYAVMLLEILRAWGVRKVLFLGWCGSIQSSVKTGDIIIPQGALIDEGTSQHYLQSVKAPVAPHAGLQLSIEQCLQRQQIDFHQGLIWTTDGIFRETRPKIEAFQKQGALAVEMELSALLSVAAFYQFPLAGLLVVSDELFTFQWRPGFKDEAFLKSRQQLYATITDWVGTL